MFITISLCVIAVLSITSQQSLFVRVSVLKYLFQDLANVVNEAAFFAIREGRESVAQLHLLQAAHKVAKMKHATSRGQSSFD